MFSTPILLIVFNRTDTALQVLQAIRTVKPIQLFIAADGPRERNAEDLEKCAATRKAVLDSIDWECEVKTSFREDNLGCGRGPVSAINWFFSQVEQGIILEDDCLPVPFFFDYCAFLLDHFKSDNKVMHISAHNTLSGVVEDKSIFFSKYSFIWGWATWRRAWEKYDYAMQQWSDSATKENIRSLCMNKTEWKYWSLAFDKYSKKENKSVWDYQWQFALFVNDGLSVVPSKSLIRNIGIGHPDATHTTFGKEEEHSVVATEGFPLNLVQSMSGIHYKFDEAVFNQVFSQWLPKFHLKIFLYEKIYKHMPGPIQKFVSAIKG